MWLAQLAAILLSLSAAGIICVEMPTVVEGLKKGELEAGEALVCSLAALAIILLILAL